MLVMLTSGWSELHISKEKTKYILAKSAPVLESMGQLKIVKIE